jgi:uncharacterized protein (DUF1330 family)
MKGYLIADLEVTDPAAFEEYRKRVPATIEQYGGRYVVRGGAIEPLEGGWTPQRVTVVEFPTLAQAQKWYRSPEYTPLIALRQKGSRGRVILVEGL